MGKDYNGILFCHKKGNPGICSNVDEVGRYAKLHKLSIER
jgi:hypothetical protein